MMQVATFIVQRILHDPTGLTYVCATYERFIQLLHATLGHLACTI